jgi:signal transduction histidine kinase
VGWALGGHRPAAGVVLNEMGVVAFYLVAMFARRLREANEQAQRLIVKLEEKRAAQTQTAALDERQRLAREMHDVLAHSLSGLVLNLEGALLLAERSPECSVRFAAAHRRPHGLGKAFPHSLSQGHAPACRSAARTAGVRS